MELLSNIEKHSGATEVTILIRSPLAGDKIHEGLVIFVTDDGNGVDEKILRAMNSKNVTSIKNQHFGLQNIKLRLNEIGGTIKYFSEKSVQISQNCIYKGIKTKQTTKHNIAD